MIWSSGRYKAVAERIAPIAAEVIDAVEQRLPVRDATPATSPAEQAMPRVDPSPA